MKAIRIEKIFAFFMALDPTLCTADALPGDAPEQTLALVTVGGTGGGPEDEIVGGGTGYGVDQGLEGLLVHVDLLKIWNNNKFELLVSLQYWKSLKYSFLTSSSLSRLGLGRAESPEAFLFIAIV